MTTITDDWAKHTWTLKTKDHSEYDVEVYVYLRLKETRADYHWPSNVHEVCDWTLEGFSTLPLATPEHMQEIENQILQRLDDEYPTN